MAYSITSACVGCFACLDVCPSRAIREEERRFRILSAACTGCAGDYADPQCASICPAEGAILDGDGVVVNPPGSLTGIPPDRLAVALRPGVL